MRLYSASCLTTDLGPPAQLLGLWYNQIAFKIFLLRRLMCWRRSHGSYDKGGADDRFQPTHRSCKRCCHRSGKRRAASIRSSAAGRGGSGIACRRQGQLLREGQRPHPLRRDWLGLPAAGDARRRLELLYRSVGACGDQHSGGVQERLPRDHHGPAQRHGRRVPPARCRSTIPGGRSPTTSWA